MGNFYLFNDSWFWYRRRLWIFSKFEYHYIPFNSILSLQHFQFFWIFSRIWMSKIINKWFSLMNKWKCNNTLFLITFNINHVCRPLKGLLIHATENKYFYYGGNTVNITVYLLAFYATLGATNNVLHKHEIVALKCVLILVRVKGINTGNTIRNTEMKTKTIRVYIRGSCWWLWIFGGEFDLPESINNLKNKPKGN